MIWGRITVDLNDPRDKYIEYRKRRFARRMELSGVRPASIARYIAKGFPGHFARAMRKEMERLVFDIKYRLGRRRG